MSTSSAVRNGLFFAPILTILAIATLSPESLQMLLPSVLLLLQSKSREVVKASLGFVKVVVVALPQEHLGPHIPDIVRPSFRFPLLLTLRAD